MDMTAGSQDSLHSHKAFFKKIEVRFPTQLCETAYVCLKFTDLVVIPISNPVSICIIFCEIANTAIYQTHNVREEVS